MPLHYPFFQTLEAELLLREIDFSTNLAPACQKMRLSIFGLKGQQNGIKRNHAFPFRALSFGYCPMLRFVKPWHTRHSR
jgi:hypothetical protein